jgi:hypothetical protein
MGDSDVYNNYEELSYRFNNNEYKNLQELYELCYELEDTKSLVYLHDYDMSTILDLDLNYLSKVVNRETNSNNIANTFALYSYINTNFSIIDKDSFIESCKFLLNSGDLFSNKIDNNYYFDLFQEKPIDNMLGLILNLKYIDRDLYISFIYKYFDYMINIDKVDNSTLISLALELNDINIFIDSVNRANFDENRLIDILTKLDMLSNVFNNKNVLLSSLHNQDKLLLTKILNSPKHGYFKEAVELIKNILSIKNISSYTYDTISTNLSKKSKYENIIYFQNIMIGSLMFTHNTITYAELSSFNNVAIFKKYSKDIFTNKDFIIFDLYCLKSGLVDITDPVLNRLNTILKEYKEGLQIDAKSKYKIIEWMKNNESVEVSNIFMSEPYFTIDLNSIGTQLLLSILYKEVLELNEIGRNVGE